MATSTPNLGLTYLLPSQSQPEVPINDAFNKIDTAVGGADVAAANAATAASAATTAATAATAAATAATTAAATAAAAAAAGGASAAPAASVSVSFGAGAPSAAAVAGALYFDNTQTPMKGYVGFGGGEPTIDASVGSPIGAAITGTLTISTSGSALVVVVGTEQIFFSPVVSKITSASGLVFTRLGGGEGLTADLEIWIAPLSVPLVNEVVTVTLTGIPSIGTAWCAFGVKGLTAPFNDAGPTGQTALPAEFPSGGLSAPDTSGGYHITNWGTTNATDLLVYASVGSGVPPAAPAGFTSMISVALGASANLNVATQTTSTTLSAQTFTPPQTGLAAILLAALNGGGAAAWRAFS